MLLALLIAIFAAALVYFVLLWLGVPRVIAGLSAALVFLIVFFGDPAPGVRIRD